MIVETLVNEKLSIWFDQNPSIAKIILANVIQAAMARDVARTSREILGANGVTLDYSPIRHMANIESVFTYEGTHDMHTLIVGEDITGIPAFD